LAADVDPLDWARSEAYWSVELERDVGVRRLERPRRYGARCANELSTRGGRPTPVVPVAAAPAETAPMLDPVGVKPAVLLTSPESSTLLEPPPLATPPTRFHEEVIGHLDASARFAGAIDVDSPAHRLRKEE
jgi:hypothetical protein